MEKNMSTRRLVTGIAAAVVAGAMVSTPTFAANETLKLGALGVMSGPFAGWGGVMCAQGDAPGGLNALVLTGPQKYQKETKMEYLFIAKYQ